MISPMEPPNQSSEAQPSAASSRVWWWVALASVAASVLMLLMAGGFAYLSWDYIERSGSEPGALDGIGYVIAVIVATPAVFSLVLLGVASLVRRSGEAGVGISRVMIAIAASVVGLETLFVLFMAATSVRF